MPPVDFNPRHAQPFTLEQAMQLEISVLVAEISRLENSIAHLQRTQDELLSYLKEDPEGDEDGEIGKAREENDEVIASQKERIGLIKVALMNKVGEGGMKHYGLNKDPSPGQAHTATQGGSDNTSLGHHNGTIQNQNRLDVLSETMEGQTESSREINESDGMYL